MHAIFLPCENGRGEVVLALALSIAAAAAACGEAEPCTSPDQPMYYSSEEHSFEGAAEGPAALGFPARFTDSSARWFVGRCDPDPCTQNGIEFSVPLRAGWFLPVELSPGGITAGEEISLPSPHLSVTASLQNPDSGEVRVLELQGGRFLLQSEFESLDVYFELRWSDEDGAACEVEGRYAMRTRHWMECVRAD
jgi:hypothetical protein